MGRMYHERVARRKASLYDEERMRKFRLVLLALPALTGCFLLSDGDKSRVEKVSEELKKPKIAAPRIPDRHPYGDVSRLKPGQWATYREGDAVMTLAAVAAEGDSMWIELIEEGDPRQVSARLVSPAGIVRKAYYGEVGKDGSRSTVEPQPLTQNGTVPAAPGGEGTGQATEETVQVGGRALQARRIEVRTEDLEGRLTRVVTVWSPEVPPIYAGSDAGGLVRRESAAGKVELVGFGTDAKPLLVLPR